MLTTTQQVEGRGLLGAKGWKSVWSVGPESLSLCFLGAVPPPGRMELGALGGARFKEQPSFPSERQSLSLTAEGLLRELVQEHRDPAFEYRSLQGFRRCGKWVGGATPIKDNKTKYQFSTLAHWCAQVSSRESRRALCVATGSSPRASLSKLY